MDPYSQYYDPFDTETMPARWRWKAERKYDLYSPMPNDPFPSISSNTSYASSDVPPTDPTPPRDARPGPSAEPAGQTSSGNALSSRRRSTRQPGLVKNPYIVREANNLKAARNRIYALIDASEEAQKAAETSKTLREAAATNESALPSAILTQRLLAGGASRSRSSTPARGPGRPAKRRRGVMEAEERYEHAYGYGDKDGEDIELEKELQKEYDEIVGKLWVEGPATTGAVISYLKARRRLLQVVDLVRQWEAYKAEHNIPDSEVSTASKAPRNKPTQAETPARRSLRARLPVPRATAQSDSDGPPRRKHRKKEHPSGSFGTKSTPTKPSGLSQSFSVASMVNEKPDSARSASSFGRSHSSLSDISSSESHDDRERYLPEPPPPAPEAVIPSVITLRKSARQATRQIKTADNSPVPQAKALPDEASETGQPAPQSHTLKSSRSLILKPTSESQNQRASSYPAPGAPEAPEGPRVLRSRSRLNVASKFDGFVATKLQT